MLTHDTIWLAIDRLAQSCGYSTSGLAKKAGLDPTAFNRSKRIGPDGKPRWPSTESVARILDATGAQLADFITMISEETFSLPSQKTKIPVLGYTQAEKGNHFDEKGLPKGEAWDQIHFPYPEQGSHGYYALEISGDSLLPLFRSGDRLILSPNAAIRRGDRIVIKTARGEIMARELVRQTAGKIELRTLTPDHDNQNFSTSEISWMARIIWVSQ